jgi:hypothetical protein
VLWFVITLIGEAALFMDNRLCIKCGRRDVTDFSKCRFCKAPYASKKEQERDERAEKYSKYAFWPIVLVVLLGLWLGRNVIGENITSTFAHRPRPIEHALIDFAGDTDAAMGEPRTKKALQELDKYVEDSRANGHNPTDAERTQFLQSKGYN